MAQIFNDAVLTDEGAKLLARSQTGAFPITFTKICTGSGIYADKSVEALKLATELLSKKQTFGIAAKKISPSNPKEVQLTSIITNRYLTVGYYLNEIGLYAQAGDDSTTEILYSITVVETDNSNYFPEYNGHSPAEIIQGFVITVSNSANVVVQISSDAYAPATDFNDHVDSSVTGEDGVHGIRYHSEIIQVYVNGEWVDAASGGGGGSLATPEEVETLAEELMEESGGGEDMDIATDEDVDETIENLDDL